ncbi:MAG TPA: hypothetical protein VFM49_05335, partial [Chloroflexia bacterium]|nr:hypothetical protein [Chloroflexia bacterium]
LGGFLWTVGLTVLGFVIGNAFGHVEGVSKYMEIFILGVIAVSLLPAAIHAWREYRHEVFAAVRARFDGA